MYKTLSSQTKPFRSVLSLVRSPFLLHPLLIPSSPPSFPLCPRLLLSQQARFGDPSTPLPFVAFRGKMERDIVKDRMREREREREIEKIRRIGEEKISLSFFFFFFFFFFVFMRVKIERKKKSEFLVSLFLSFRSFLRKYRA